MTKDVPVLIVARPGEFWFWVRWSRPTAPCLSPMATVNPGFNARSRCLTFTVPGTWGRDRRSRTAHLAMSPMLPVCFCVPRHRRGPGWWQTGSGGSWLCFPNEGLRALELPLPVLPTVLSLTCATLNPSPDNVREAGQREPPEWPRGWGHPSTPTLHGGGLPVGRDALDWRSRPRPTAVPSHICPPAPNVGAPGGERGPGQVGVMAGALGSGIAAQRGALTLGQVTRAKKEEQGPRAPEDQDRIDKGAADVWVIRIVDQWFRQMGWGRDHTDGKVRPSPRSCRKLISGVVTTWRHGAGMEWEVPCAHGPGEQDGARWAQEAARGTEGRAPCLLVNGQLTPNTQRGRHVRVCLKVWLQNLRTGRKNGQSLK